MGTWRQVRAAFLIGSLFMILLIILYWDDVSALNLYDPLRDLYTRRDPWSTSTQTSSPPPSPGPSLTPPFSLFWGSLAALGRVFSSLPPSRGDQTGVDPILGEVAEPGSHSHPPLDLITPAGQRRGKEEGKQRMKAEEREVGEERMRGEEEREVGEERRRKEEEGRQKERRRRIRGVCSGGGSVEFPGRTLTFNQIPNTELDHLIVDDKHKVIYCYVPKVACTNWKRVMVVLSQGLLATDGQPYADPQAVPSDLVHNSTLHLTFSKFWRRYGRLSRHLMSVKLQSYTKFLFVRDPFVRLISAFRNKLGQPNQDFYRQFGAVMLRRYGDGGAELPETAAEAFSAGLRPSFTAFVRYLLDPETEREEEFNEHWRQVYRLCHPCQVNYDFVGRLEDLERDADQLLRILGVDRLIRFPPSNRNRTATSWERDWFAGVPLDLRRKLYELYEPDFKLFGYPKPQDLLHL
ncbi:carbohydrate sulfotransferase 12-like [Osmerus eperlanus]|uniref:carbohydrate sulfotransferase 12-like n=1 Tax=Osmerus eperlanus TaxID=29151 RepID=UPI002E10E261